MLLEFFYYSSDLPDSRDDRSIHECPKKRNRNNKYLFTFETSYHFFVYEDDVEGDEEDGWELSKDNLDEVKTMFKNSYKNSRCPYPVRKVKVDSIYFTTTDTFKPF